MQSAYLVYESWTVDGQWHSAIGIFSEPMPTMRRDREQDYSTKVLRMVQAETFELACKELKESIFFKLN
jgi:hypothetical protein